MGDQRLATAPEVAAAIALYVHAHPEAADNLKGVVECWLHRDAKDLAFLEMAQQALDLLVERGELERRTIAGGQALYRRARP